MFSTDEMIKRFCTSINKDARMLEKKDFRDKIDDFLRTGEVTTRLDTDGVGSVSYRMEYERCFLDNFNLTCAEVNGILEEYKDAGYRCILCNSSSTEEVLPDISIQFQVLIQVNKIPNAIPIMQADKYNYILPGECHIIKN